MKEMKKIDLKSNRNYVRQLAVVNLYSIMMWVFLSINGVMIKNLNKFPNWYNASYSKQAALYDIYRYFLKAGYVLGFIVIIYILYEINEFSLKEKIELHNENKSALIRITIMTTFIFLAILVICVEEGLGGLTLFSHLVYSIAPYVLISIQMKQREKQINQNENEQIKTLQEAL